MIIERIVLNCTDLTGGTTGCTTKGSNKFWIGEVLKNPQGTFDFVCKWGEVGKDPSTKGSVYGVSESAAMKKLHAKARDKQKPGRSNGTYVRVDTRSQQEEIQKAADAGVDLVTGKAATPKKAAAPSRSFHPEVSRLLSVFYDSTSRAVQTGLSATAGSTSDNPIGNLSDAQLDLGGSLLDEIGDLLQAQLGPADPNNQTAMAQTLPLVGGRPSTRVTDLTNRYLSAIPRAIDRRKMGPTNFHMVVVSSYERLQAEREFLQLLRDAHLTRATFQKAATSSATDKIGVWYDGLACDIEFCPPGSEGHKFASHVFNTKQSRRNANWWHGDRSRLRVRNVWRFTRQGSADRFSAYAQKTVGKPGALGNIWAWHGTRIENLLGIGKSGLLMPENLPRGVHISGKAFGRGIYHAPVSYMIPSIGGVPTDDTNGVLKSMNYTGTTGAYYGSGSGNTAYMFLQEVALGKPDVHRNPCWDQHRPGGWPENDFIFAASSQCSTLTHDEIVTFQEDAQVFRYLLEIDVL